MYTKDSISNELNKVQVTPITEAILDLHHHLLTGLLVILGLIITYISLYIYNKRIWIINSIVSLFMVLGIMFNDEGVHAVGRSIEGRSEHTLLWADINKIKDNVSLDELKPFIHRILYYAVTGPDGDTFILNDVTMYPSTVSEAKEIIFDIFSRSKDTYAKFGHYLDHFDSPADTVAEKVVDAVASSSLAVPEDDSYPKYIKYGLIVSSMLFGGYMIYKGMEISGLLDNLFGSKIPDGEIIKDSMEKATTKEKIVGVGMIVLGLTCIVTVVIVIFGGK